MPWHIWRGLNTKRAEIAICYAITSTHCSGLLKVHDKFNLQLNFIKRVDSHYVNTYNQFNKLKVKDDEEKSNPKQTFKRANDGVRLATEFLMKNISEFPTESVSK